MSYTTYVTHAALIGGFVSVTVCVFFHFVLQGYSRATQFKIAAAFRLFPGLMELCISRRLNLAIGISDEVGQNMRTGPGET